MTILSDTYNGWANWATWRVHLEIFDGFDLRGMGWHKLALADLAGALQEYVDELVFCDVKDGLAADYARAFLSDVNWWEIARALREYADESDEEFESCE